MKVSCPRHVVPSVLLLLAAACAREAAQAARDAGTPAPAARPTTPPVAAPGHTPVLRVAAARVALRQQPQDKARAVTVLNFGEALEPGAAVDGGGAYTAVRTADGTAGYVPADAIALAQGLATLLQEQDIYARPDALSPVRKRLKRGVLMLVTADRNGWRQVRLPDRTEGWLPRDRATDEEPEMVHARALWRSEQATADKLPDVAMASLQDALAAHPGARLAPMTSARLAPLLPPDAGVADSGAVDGAGVPVASADAAVMAPAGDAGPAPAAVNGAVAAPAPTAPSADAGGAAPAP